MQKILISDPGQLELLKTHDRIEICDDAGKPIGFFVSFLESDSKLYEWAKSQLTEEELSRRKNERDQGRTTSEVIKRLRTSSTPSCGTALVR